MLIAGIDPGFNGAIAYIEWIDKTPRLLCVKSLPTCKVVSGKWKHTDYRVPALRSLICDVAPECKCYVIEKIAMVEGDGKFSKTATATGFGLISGLIQADPSNKLVAVHPTSWQAKMFRSLTSKGVAKANTKCLSAKVALSVFPDAPIYGPRGGLLDGLSDAICLALYGSLVLKD